MKELLFLILVGFLISCSDFETAEYENPINSVDTTKENAAKYLDSLRKVQKQVKDTIYEGDLVLSGDAQFPDSIKIFNGDLTIEKNSKIRLLKSDFTVNGNFSLPYAQIVKLYNITVNGDMDISYSDVIRLENIKISGNLIAKDMPIFPKMVSVFIRDSIIE